MFSTLSNRVFIILTTLNLSSANALNLVKLQILSFGKELIVVLIVKILIFPKRQFLDRSKLKAFADDSINVAEKLKNVLGRVEKEKMASSPGLLKVGILW